MAAYLIRRIAYAVLVLLGVNIFTFVLFFSVNSPDDMARLNIGGKRVTAEQISQWRAERGYQKPLYFNPARSGMAQLTDTIFADRSVSLLLLQFGRADGDAGGDIGYEIRSRMPASLALALPTFLLTLGLSVGFALFLVYLRNSAIDFWGVVLCVVLLSISSLFYIIVGQFLFAKTLRLLPVSGFAAGLAGLKFLILPVLLAVLARLGGDARLNRALFLEEIAKDYVRTARAKGLTERLILLRHVLRNALIPILTSAGAYLPYIFMGSLVFESFFGIPGLGSYVIDAIGGQDFAIVRVMVFIGSLLYITSYLMIDILYSLVDPRVRLA